MRRLLASLVIASFLLLPTSSTQAASPYPAILDSIAPIQHLEFNGETGDLTLANHCTAGFINQQKRYWLTAAHCVGPVGNKEVINGFEGIVIASDLEVDLAIVETKHYVEARKALKLASKPVKWFDRIKTAGFSLGYPYAFYFEGTVALPSFTFPDGVAPKLTSRTYTIFDMPIAGRQSGSPILNEDGRLVSVMQIGYGMQGGFGVVSGGATLKQLKGFAADYFGR